MTGRHVLQFRPRGSDEMPYSPQRDLAVLYVPAMREALSGLDQVNWRPFFKDWMDACDLNEDSLAEAVKCFVEAHRLFTGDPEISQPNDAFAKSGFAAVNPAAQAAIYFRLGEVIAAGFFVAMRDVTTKGDVPPNVDEITQMVVAGRRMAERLTGVTKRELDTREQFEAKIESMRLQMEEYKFARQRMWEMVHKADSAYAKLADQFHAAVCESNADMSRVRARTLWQTLQDWWDWKVRKRIVSSATS